ncbi:GntR family transcriptional regulator [Bifidobacterium cuniculi]|uniref:GntR family transcriptional regulator n=1 Tax=Bifidobacterium cuniculi TaxID=1688 RepID=A0A087AHU1_9BIFI|nr:GntR family transcriptional regulator [Bifidobacterium cuniculi]KFI58341.1 GntR family transcriptional regulator [Bifidobacterium cuniculi]
MTAVAPQAAAEVIAARLRSVIRTQGLRPGERLGTERAIAQELGVSRASLRGALASMEASHEIVRKIGRSGGVIVSDGKLERNLDTVESLTQIARRQGRTLTSKVLSSALAAADSADARLLRLPEERRMVIVVSRLRMLDGRPFCLETTHLPAYRFPGFLERDLTGSFYGMFECGYGIRPHHVEETLDCCGVDGEADRLLGDPDAVMRIRRLAWDERECPCEVAVDLYRADLIRFTMHHSGFVRLSAARQ